MDERQWSTDTVYIKDIDTTPKNTVGYTKNIFELKGINIRHHTYKQSEYFTDKTFITEKCLQLCDHFKPKSELYDKIIDQYNKCRQ